MATRAEFTEIVHKTGTTTKRAVVRVYDGDEHLFSVLMGVTYSAMKASEEDILRVLPTLAEQLVSERLLSDPTWVAEHTGDQDLVWDLSTADLDDLDRLKALLSAP